MLTVATLQLCAAMSLAAPSTASAALRHRPVLLAMQQGTKPDVHKQDAQEQKISVVDAVAMVGGSAVGGGFLAVPEVTATLGILPSTAGLLMSWAFLVMAGLAYVEAAGACCRDADGEGRKPSCSILALSRRSFGRRLPRLPTALSCVFLAQMFAIVTANLCKAAELATVVAPALPFSVSAWLVAAVLGSFVFAAPRHLVASTNTALSSMMCLGFLAVFGVAAVVAPPTTAVLTQPARWSRLLPQAGWSVPIFCNTLRFGESVVRCAPRHCAPSTAPRP